MKINNPTKFFAETPVDDGYNQAKYRSTIMTRGDVIKKYAAYDAMDETQWHVTENKEADSWVKFSFDGGISYPLKFRYKNTLLMKFIKNEVPHAGDEFEFDFSMYSALDYSSIRNGRISLYALSNEDGWLTHLPCYRYNFDDTTKTLHLMLTMEPPADSVKTVILIELDGHSAMAMAVPTPVFSSFVGMDNMSVIEELGNVYAAVLNTTSGENTVTCSSNLTDVRKLKIRVRASDSQKSGNVKLEFKFSANDAFTEVIPVTATSTWQTIELSGPMEGNLTITRLVDEADTLDCALYITNIVVEIFS